MPRPQLRDAQWERVDAILKACPGIDVGHGPATRRFVEAVLWMARAGCAWRLVPDVVGGWNSVYKRRALAGEGRPAGADGSSGGRRRSRVADARQHRGAGPRRRRRGKKPQASRRSAARAAATRPSCSAGDARGSPLALADASRHGRALIDRALYLPEVWSEDQDRRAEAGIPGEVRFLTKPKLGLAMLEGAHAAGVPFAPRLPAAAALAETDRPQADGSPPTASTAPTMCCAAGCRSIGSATCSR